MLQFVNCGPIWMWQLINYIWFKIKNVISLNRYHCGRSYLKATCSLWLQRGLVLLEANPAAWDWCDHNKFYKLQCCSNFTYLWQRFEHMAGNLFKLTNLEHCRKMWGYLSWFFFPLRLGVALWSYLVDWFQVYF